MAANKTTIAVSDAMRHVTMDVTITGLNTLRARLWLAKSLIRLAAIVGGVRVEIH